jgi:DNA-binding NtrC family response regulator
MGNNTVSEILKQYANAISSPSNIAIWGESGVGKEYLARMIHERKGKSGPFVLYDCESTYDIQVKIVQMLEKEFKKPGVLEPQTNTLFLRKVELLREELVKHSLSSLEANLEPEQAKELGLICSIEIGEGAIQRFGPLHKLLSNYFEINIRIPPLRERKDEIIPTAYNYIQYSNRENNRKILNITPEAKRLLLTYNWPGNFGELYSELERAVAFTKDLESIKPSCFSQTFFQN